MEYGRRSQAGQWFQTKPVGVITALLLTGVATMAMAQYRYAHWPVLQRVYLPLYVRAVVASHVGFSRYGTYTLWLLHRPDGTEFLAVDRDLIQTLPSDGLLRSAGVGTLRRQTDRYRHQEIAGWLQAAIFDGQRIRDLVTPILWWTGGVGLVAIVVAIPIDQRRARERRQGRHLRGPEFVSTREFTKRVAKGQW